MPAASRSALSMGWFLLAVVILATNLRAPLAALGPVVSEIRTDLGISGSFMGLVAALPMLVFALVSPLAARLARRLGMETVLIGAMVVLLVGIGLRVMYPSAVWLAIGTVVLSAAIAMGNVLLPALAKQQLPSRIGLVVGALSATMSLSSAVAALIAVPLAQWRSWQWSLGVWGITAGLAVLIWLWVKRQNTAAVAPQHATATRADFNVWRMPAAWCISAFMGVQSLLFYSIVNFLPSVLEEKGLTAWAAGAYVSLFQLASLAGVLIVSAYFAHHRYRQGFNLLIAVFMLVGVLGIWLAPVSSMWLWVSCVGLGTAGSFSAALMLFALRTENSMQAAMLSGMAQGVGYTIAIAGPLGMGMIYDQLGSWSVSMGILAGLMVIECILAWFAAQPHVLR